MAFYYFIQAISQLGWWYLFENWCSNMHPLIW